MKAKKFQKMPGNQPKCKNTSILYFIGSFLSIINGFQQFSFDFSNGDTFLHLCKTVQLSRNMLFLKKTFAKITVFLRVE